MKKKFTFIMLMALFAMTARAFTYYNNVEIGNYKYDLSLGSSSSEESKAVVKGFSSAGASSTTIDVPSYVIYNNNRYRVYAVESEAFKGETSVTKIVLNYGLTNINSSAFWGCKNVTLVRIPSSVNFISAFVFNGCNKLSCIAYASEKVPSTHSSAFYGMPSGVNLSLVSGKAVAAFNGNSTWKTAFGNGANIGRHRAYYSYDFASGYVYYTIQSPFPYSYSKAYCKIVAIGSGQTSVTLSQNIGNGTANNSPGSFKVAGVADSAAMNNTTITKIVSSNTTATRIGRYAFYGCTNLTSADVPVDTIDAYAFMNCSKLSSVNFEPVQYGTYLVMLNGYAFANCNLTTVTIPASVKNIGYAPFYNNANMTSITVDAANTNYCSHNGCLYNKSKTWLYQIPCKWNYSTVNADNNFGFAPELVRVLNYAGYKVSTLTSLNLTYGVTTLENAAFAECANLTSVRLPSSIVTDNVANNAFVGCTAIKNIYLNIKNPPSKDFFPSCTNPGNVNLYVPYVGELYYPDNSIWNKYNIKTGTYDHTNCWDFYYNGLYYTVTSASSFSQDGNSYAGKCEMVLGGIGTYSIAASIPRGGKNYRPISIGARAFTNGQASVTLNGCTTIETVNADAFNGIRLTNFPFKNVKIIVGNAFKNTKYLNAPVTGLTALQEVGSNAFDGSVITAFTSPATLTYIGSNAFARTNSLKTIDLSASTSLTKINSYAFAQISSTPSGSSPGAAHEVVKLPNSITNIGEYAFYKNILTTFNFPSKLKTLATCALKGVELAGVVELPYGITTLEEDCLSGAFITRIVLPSSVTAVHSRFFNVPYYQNPVLSDVVINTKNPLSFTNDNEDINYSYQRATGITDANIYVPVGMVSTWKADSHWSFGFNICEGSYDFTDRNNGFKYSVRTAGDETSINGRCDLVYNPETINRASTIDLSTVNYDQYGRRYSTYMVGDKAFYGSTTLTNVLGVRLGTLKIIGKYAFYKCTKLNKITHSGSADANYNSTSYLGTNVNSIGAYAFNGCKNLHELFLPHIDGKNALTCGNDFFGNNASDFKCWVDYRRLDDFMKTTWDQSKIYPHLLLDSDWQSFACVKTISFQGSNLEAYTVSNYNQSQKQAILSNVANVSSNNGAVVHGNANGRYYRLNYASSGATSTWLDGITGESQSVNSNSSLSFFKLNATKPKFDKITTSTTFNRGYAYLKLNTSVTGGATTILTNLSGSEAIPGDVNNDGVVSSVDITILYNYLLNNDTTYMVNGDQDGDGVITSVDITIIYNILLGNN